jgi:hypothetical protein
MSQDHIMYLTPVEAGRTLNLSTSKLAKLRMTHDGPKYRKFGRAVRYSRVELLEWADRQARECTTERVMH